MTKKCVAEEGARWKPIRTTKWRGDRQLTKKRIQSNSSKDILKSQKKNGCTDAEDIRNIQQRYRKTKERRWTTQ